MSWTKLPCDLTNHHPDLIENKNFPAIFHAVNFRREKFWQLNFMLLFWRFISVERFPHPKPLNRDQNLFIFAHQFVLYGRSELLRSFLSGKNVLPSIESKWTNEHCILVFLRSSSGEWTLATGLDYPGTDGSELHWSTADNPGDNVNAIPSSELENAAGKLRSIADYLPVRKSINLIEKLHRNFSANDWYKWLERVAGQLG